MVISENHLHLIDFRIVNTQKNNILQLSFAWLLLLAMVTTAIDGQSFVADTDVVDSIEYEKELKDGEKEVELIFSEIVSFSFEYHNLKNLVSTQIQFCEIDKTSRTPERLYVLYKQFKTHLG